MSEAIVRTARRLAEALDAEDYSAAGAVLAEGCVYHTGTATLKGRDAIIASYRANGEAARGRFDAIEYASRVEASGPSEAVIGYTDRVRIGDRWHEYHCRQHVRIDETGVIEEIRHEELPGERERLQEFERR
jgi:SnoaL-like domain